MKLLLASLATALLAAAQSEPASPLVQRLQQEMESLAAEAAEMDGDLPRAEAAQETPFDPSAPMPDKAADQSIAVADGGLLFDVGRSRLAYIGNVRLSDPRVQLRAAHRLYVHLPKNEKKRAEENAPTPTAAEPTPTAQNPLAPQAAPAAAEAETTLPAEVVAEDVAVDVPGSRVLLTGRAATPSLSIVRGQDSIILQQAEQTPAQAFANAQGDVLLLGSRMVFIWHNAAGEEWKLEAATGPIFFEQASRRLTVQGKAHITSPRGSMECSGHMSVVFAAAAEQEPLATSPFSALSNMQFKEVQQATAKGDVLLTTPATATRPAGLVRGDTLDYDAASGQCLISGDDCSVVYGNSSLHHAGAIELAGDGNAAIRPGKSAEEISGSYERPLPSSPAATADAPTTLQGTWRTAGEILYDAQQNCYTFTRGLSAQDSAASFSCTELLQIYTIPQAAEPSRKRQPSLPNLALARQGQVQRVLARGEVTLHADATPSSAACDVSGDELEARLSTAEIKLTAAQKAHTRYGAYELTAQSPQSSGVSINLLPNGDILAEGGLISAILPGEKGTIRAQCSRRLHLQREQALLTLGENSRIDSPDGILTARAPLQAELIRGDGPSRAPKQHPQLQYNFAGLRRASTPGGGTLRTTQVSMQCEGAIEVVLTENTTPGADPRKMLRSALARDRVSLAGRDATGRLVRAGGDRLDFDPASGNFYLRGRVVSLADQYNTHTASGAGACVTIDARNNVRITGAHQSTTANRIQQQMDSHKKQ